jgi:hypothetical protein
LMRGSAPDAFGSGKFDTPWARMHLARASCCATGRLLFCPEGDPTPPPMSDWHAFDAFWNTGELVLIPVPFIVNCPSLLGSGKFGTPCERIHSENRRVFT